MKLIKIIVNLSLHSMSIHSMDNKRQIAKYKTFNKIIEAAREVISEKGIIKLKTIDIATRANIAHGTLFAHFTSKEILISEVCHIELKRIAIKLRELTNDRTIEISELLDKYLLLIAKNEDFYTVIAKEFPFIGEKIQQSIIANEIIIRNILYEKIESSGFIVPDITMIIAYFFATLNYYLSRKEYFVNGNTPLMMQKKNQIITTFLNLLTT